MTATADAREGYVQVTGGRIWYYVAGGGAAVPIVIVHGGPGNNARLFATVGSAR